MSDVKVLSTRVDEYIDEGIACGPISIDVVGAEAVIQDGDKKKYITICYVSEAGETLECDITDEPIYDFLVGECSDEDIDVLDKRRDAGEQYTLDTEEDYDGPYLDIIKMLCRKIYDKAVEENIIGDDMFDYQEDVYPWISDFAGVTMDLPEYEDNN